MFELHAVNLSAAQAEAQRHGVSFTMTDVYLAAPGDGMIEVVADKAVAGVEGAIRQHFPIGTHNLHLDVSSH